MLGVVDGPGGAEKLAQLQGLVLLLPAPLWRNEYDAIGEMAPCCIACTEID